MRTIAHIIYAQGEEANTAFDALDFLGTDGLIEHLAQWDNGEYYDTFEDDEENYYPNLRKEIGSASKLHIQLPYLVGYNVHFETVSLYKVIQ